jgi:uncharacterized protein YndB with AHSA1/START domain
MPFADVESVERLIPAPPDRIFALLADAAKHPEIDGSGTVRHAKGNGSTQLTLGSTFGMAMKMGLGYSVVNTVVEFEQDRLIAWQTRSPLPLLGRFLGGRIWRYELQPVKGGTLVRESWDISGEKIKLLLEPLRAKNRNGMTETLARIEDVVTST